MHRSPFFLLLFLWACVPSPPATPCAPACLEGQTCKDGVCTSQPPASFVSHEAHKQALSGSRLKVRILHAADGAKVFLGFYDTTLKEPCTFQNVQDLTKGAIQDTSSYCVPSSVSSASGRIFYSDAACSPSRRFAVGLLCKDGPSQILTTSEVTQPACKKNATLCVRLGASVPLPAAYYKRHNGACQLSSELNDHPETPLFEATEECSETLFQSLWVSAEEKLE